MRLATPEIVEGMSRIQRDMCAQNPLVSQFATPPSKAHLTLSVFAADGADELATAVAAIDATLDRCPVPAPLHLDVCGLRAFGTRVVYAEVHSDASGEAYVRHLAASMHEALSAAQIAVPRWRPLVPHATLFKTWPGAKGSIRPRDWEAFSEARMGQTLVTDVEVCQMSSSAGSYYVVDHTSKLQTRRDPRTDHCPPSIHAAAAATTPEGGPP